jgi:hypothetical protein
VQAARLLALGLAALTLAAAAPARVGEAVRRGFSVTIPPAQAYGMLDSLRFDPAVNPDWPSSG